MSIKPRVIDRNRDKTVQLHMHVQNDENFAITGKIIMEMVSPERTIIRTIEKEVRIEGRQTIDEFFSHDTANLAKGRFFVNGKFVINDQKFISETSNTDFFDVVK